MFGDLGALGLLEDPLGGLCGPSVRPCGDRWAPSDATFGEQASLQNRCFYSKMRLGADPGGSQLTAKTGDDKANEDCGAQNEPETIREETEEKKNTPGANQSNFRD